MTELLVMVSALRRLTRPRIHLDHELVDETGSSTVLGFWSSQI